MADTSARDYQRLAELARKRRGELALPLNDANAKGGDISKGTWRRVEQGLEIRETNYVKVDRLMQWAPGSCIRVLEGGEPVPVEDRGGVQVSPMPAEAVEGQARDVVQLALIATAKGTTAEEIREMSERVVRDLRERGLL